MQLPMDAISKFANGEDNITEPIEDTTDLPDMDFGDDETTEDELDVNEYSEDYPEKDNQDIKINDEDDDDDFEVIGVNKENVDKEIDANTTSYDEYNRILNEQMANLKNDDPNTFMSRSDEMLRDIIKYRKELMIKNGFTQDEADAAARARLKNKARAAEKEYLDEHPSAVEVVIDKTQSDNLEFTEDEKSKLEKTKKIRLLEIEDTALSTLKLKKVDDRKERLNVIYRKSCNLSNYSQPFYNTIDYMTFNGATIYAMLNATKSDIKNSLAAQEGKGTSFDFGELYSSVLKKAQFLYDHFMRSATKEKYDIDGNIILSFNDFLNWFNYYDIDNGIYTIYVASSTEMITSGFKCNATACRDATSGEGKPFNATYNTRSIVRYDRAEDSHKEVLDDILGSKDNTDKMKGVIEKHKIQKRVRSMFTENCYDFSSPTINDYLLSINALDENGAGENEDPYIKDFVAWTRAIYVKENPDDPDSEYIQITDIDDIVVYYKNMVETERSLIISLLTKYIYMPYYSIKTICPNCGHESDVEMEVSTLVFQRARSLEAAIEM